MPVTLLALAGAVAGLVPRRAAALTPGAIALPWLATPAVILLAVSQAHPLFTVRYVEFSQPALALLCAAGLSGLAEVAARLSRRGLARPVAWLPAAAIMVLLGVLLAGPQQALRRPGSRVDNLRRASAVLAAHELPGDAVLYLPSSRRIVSMAYPGPFRRLHDIALDRPPAASATLAGTEVDPAALRHRFAGVRRVWLVTIRDLPHPPPDSRTDQAKIALIRQPHLAGRWHAGAVVLRLYARDDRRSGGTGAAIAGIRRREPSGWAWPSWPRSFARTAAGYSPTLPAGGTRVRIELPGEPRASGSS